MLHLRSSCIATICFQTPPLTAGYTWLMMVLLLWETQFQCSGRELDHTKYSDAELINCNRYRTEDSKRFVSFVQSFTLMRSMDTASTTIGFSLMHCWCLRLTKT